MHFGVRVVGAKPVGSWKVDLDTRREQVFVGPACGMPLLVGIRRRR